MSLFKLLVEIAADLSPFKRGLDQAGEEAKKGGDEAGRKFAQKLKDSLAQQMGGGGFLDTVMGGGLKGAASLGIIRGLGAVTVAASDASAQMAAYRRQLEGISGSATKAQEAFDGLATIARNSNFDTKQVFELGIKFAGRTGDVKKAVEEAQRTIDAAQVFGVSNQDFGDFQRNLTQMTNRGSAKIEVTDLQEFLNRAPLAITQIAHALGTSTEQAAEKLKGATGDDFKKMMDAVGAANKGAAGRAAGVDPRGNIANAKDALEQGLAATGDLINRGLTPLTAWLARGANAIADFNKRGGGFPALTVMIGAGVLAARLGTAAFREATAALMALTAAAKRLAGEGGAAAAAAGGKGGTSGIFTPGNLALLEPGQQLDDAQLRKLRSHAPPWLNQMIAKFSGGEKKPETAMDKLTAAVEANTKALQNTKFTTLGGGERTGKLASLLEREYQGALIRGIG